jgi:4-amino-4-deoxy-L-arabinose transferase-like glycosyltransferase
MTTLAPPTPTAVPARPAGLSRLLVRARAGEAAWVLPAAGVLALAAVLYVVNLTVSGYANVYYSGAAWAASQSWAAWFQGAIDPGTFITIDKPPLATMVMGLSVRLFGLSSASILLPEALMGVATVALLMATVRRTFGAPASIIAGLVTALTPAAVLIFRYNNPDALLTLLLVAAAYALVRALESDRFRWLVLSGVLVGLAFNTKLLQAYLVLPAFALTFALCAPGSLKRRAAGLAVAAVSVVAGSAWWVAAMELIPASARAYVGGSTGNSALDLVLGYDGLGRIFGQAAGGSSGGPGGGGFSGTPGILRLFNAKLGGQIGWFLPASIVGLGAGLLSRLRAPRTDLARAGFILWGGWLAVHAVVFSLMSGTIHSYYVVAMAPAVGALTGGGLVALWRARERFAVAGLALGLTLFGSAGIAWMLLDRTPSFAPGLGIAALAVTGIVLPVLALAPHADRAKAQLVAAALGFAVLLAGPAASAIDTMGTSYSGGDPAAGPAATSTDALSGDGRMAMGGNGGQVGGGMAGGPGMGGSSLSDGVLAYLEANQGDATWLIAVSDASTASQLELTTGRAVMSTGGFTGSDDALTLERLQSLVAGGELRFIVVGDARGGPGGGASASSEVSSWVTSACSVVSVDGSTTSVHDCSGAVSG